MWELGISLIFLSYPNHESVLIYLFLVMEEANIESRDSGIMELVLDISHDLITAFVRKNLALMSFERGDLQPSNARDTFHFGICS